MPEPRNRAAELALCEINNGARYAQRREIARMPARNAAVNMARVACMAAREYERDFAADPFTAEEILLCAAELAEYYARHNAESDALKCDEGAA